MTLSSDNSAQRSLDCRGLGQIALLWGLQVSPPVKQRRGGGGATEISLELENHGDSKCRLWHQTARLQRLDALVLKIEEMEIKKPVLTCWVLQEITLNNVSHTGPGTW